MDMNLRLSRNTKALILLALAITFLTALVPLWRIGAQSEELYIMRLAAAGEDNSPEDAAIRLAGI